MTIKFFTGLDAERRDALLQAIRRRVTREYCRMFARRLDEAVKAYRVAQGLTQYPLLDDPDRYASVQSSFPDPADQESHDGLFITSAEGQRRERMRGQAKTGGGAG